MKLHLRSILVVLLFSVGCVAKNTPPPPYEKATVAPSPTPLPHERKLLFDFLALQHKDFRVSKAIQYVAPGVGSGNLDYAFGASLSPVRQLLDSGKIVFFRTHFLNGPGVNNGVAAPYEITYRMSAAQLDAAIKREDPKIINYLKERISLYCDLIPQYPKITFALSPILEGVLGQDSWKILNKTTLESCKRPFVLVNSPRTGTIPLTHGAKLETHGHRPPGNPFISSLDGIDVYDIKVVPWLQRTEEESYTGVWSKVYNCRHQGNWEDPRNRTACPTDGQFEELSHITDNRGPSPKVTPLGCAVVKPFSSPWIGKPSAENKGIPDTRKGKPVYIIPIGGSRGQSLSILDKNGREVGKMGYYGAYSTPGYHRWYSGYSPGTSKYGYQFEKLAKQSSGSPYTWIKKKGTSVCYGPLILSRRQGEPYVK